MKAEIKIITNEDYHLSEGLSSSSIKMLLECPRKYYWTYILKNKKPSTDAMIEGSAFHDYILEIHKFNELKWAKKIDKFKNMKESLYSLSGVEKMLDDGDAEQSIYWKDEETGILLKTRPDYINYRVSSIFDLKTTCDASKEGFSKSIYNFGYHIQAALAVEGLKQLTGKDFSFVNLAVEKTEPYCSAAYYIDDISLELGKKQYKKALQIYKKCIENNHWPSYVHEIETLGVPFWAENKFLMGE